MPISRLALAMVVACLVLGIATQRTGAAPQSAPPADATAVLLAEVHELRLAMERSATIAPRVQLTLARLNIQEQRTVLLSTQLEQVRQELANANLETKKLSNELEDLQKALPTVSDASGRRGLEFEEQSLRRNLTQQATVEERLRGREGEAAQLLSTEQSRWRDLNAKLDELERLLGPVR